MTTDCKCFRNHNYFQLQFYLLVTPAVSQICCLYNIAVLPSMRIQDQGKCIQYNTTQKAVACFFCFFIIFKQPVKMQILSHETCLIFLGKLEKLLFYASISTLLWQEA